MQVIEHIVKAEVHRLIVTNDENQVVGIISLSDILRHIVLEIPKTSSSNLHALSQSPINEHLNASA